jgi:hypothetical protein
MSVRSIRCDDTRIVVYKDVIFASRMSLTLKGLRAGRQHGQTLPSSFHASRWTGRQE